MGISAATADALAHYEIRPQAGELGIPDWGAVFCQESPLWVEVGYGNGDWLTWAAAEYPDRSFLGMESSQACTQRAARRLQLAGIEQVRLLRGDARTLLRELFGGGQLAGVVMQFPMPWPKARHAKHRVSSPSFAATLADVLQPNGEFELVTDQAWYAAETREAFASNPAFAIAEDCENPADRPFRTRYELRWLEAGRSIYRLRFRLLQPSPSPRVFLPSTEMDSAVLKKTPTAPQLNRLLGTKFTGDGWVAELQDLLVGERDFLLRAVAADGAFSQRFFLRIRCRQDGSALLRADDIARPYFTKGVHGLIAQTAACLESRAVGEAS